jgi:hypothetical protein
VGRSAFQAVLQNHVKSYHCSKLALKYQRVLKVSGVLVSCNNLVSSKSETAPNGPWGAQPQITQDKRHRFPTFVGIRRLDMHNVTEARKKTQDGPVLPLNSPNLSETARCPQKRKTVGTKQNVQQRIYMGYSHRHRP